MSMDGAPPSVASLTSARTLVAAGIGLQAAQVGAFFLFAFYITPHGSQALIYVVLALLGLAWLALAVALVYRPLRAGHVVRARSAALVFAILSLFTISILPGLMYILAHHEMRAHVASDPPRPLGTARPLEGGLKTCSMCGRANPPASTFCQGCGLVVH